MGARAQKDVTDIFNRMFSSFAQNDGGQLERLQENIFELSTDLHLNDDLHEVLQQVARAAGHKNPEYKDVSQAFTKMADLLVWQADRAEGLERQSCQQDACVMLIFAEVSTPRQRDGSVMPEHAQPILDTSYRLLSTLPDEQIVDLTMHVCDLLKVRRDILRVEAGSTPRGAPHLDRMAGFAHSALNSYRH